MTRRMIPDSVVARVLLESRRRCCICFGLNRSVDLASGQIAHLDKNNANSDYGNLAFLCLKHHDEYDSRTSQRKNFTLFEVKAYQAELISAMEFAMSCTVSVGTVNIDMSYIYAGSYILIDEGPLSAEITISALPNFTEGQKYHVTGLAIRDVSRHLGAHMGVIDQIASMLNRKITVTRPAFCQEQAVTQLILGPNQTLEVAEWNIEGEYGQGVDFRGTYKKVDSFRSASLPVR